MKLDADGFVKRSDQTHSIGHPENPMSHQGYDAAYIHQGSDATVVTQPFIKDTVHPCAGLPGLGSKGPSTFLNGLDKLKQMQAIPEDAFDLPITTIVPNGGPLLPPYHDWQEDVLTPCGKLNARNEGDDLTQIEPTNRSTLDEDFGPNASERAAEEALLAQMTTEVTEETEYTTEFGPKGEAYLMKLVHSTHTRLTKVASFETMADAQTAAQALNEHCGY